MFYFKMITIRYLKKIYNIPTFLEIQKNIHVEKHNGKSIQP
jgi:hypothetical protein